MYAQSSSLRIENLEVCMDEKLGTGQSADVFKGIATFVVDAKQRRNYESASASSLDEPKFRRKIPVAVKVFNHLPGSAEMRDEFYRTRMICDLVPQGVVRTHAIAAHPDDEVKTCIVMELMDHTMHDERTKRGFDPVSALPRTLFHFAQVAETLHEIHETAGVVVLDIKPKNILIDKLGTSAKIADFGVSQAVRGIETNTGLTTRDAGVATAGTPPYFSPEQAGASDPNDESKGQKRAMKVTKQSDIWNIGASLLEMLTGRDPWSEHTIYAIRNRLQVGRKHPEIDLSKSFPDKLRNRLEALLERCFAPIPKDRYTALELGVELRELWRMSVAVGDAGNTVPVVPRPVMQQGPVLTMLAAFLAVVVAVILAPNFAANHVTVNNAASFPEPTLVARERDLLYKACAANATAAEKRNEEQNAALDVALTTVDQAQRENEVLAEQMRVQTATHNIAHARCWKQANETKSNHADQQRLLEETLSELASEQKQHNATLAERDAAAEQAVAALRSELEAAAAVNAQQAEAAATAALKEAAAQAKAAEKTRMEQEKQKAAAAAACADAERKKLREARLQVETMKAQLDKQKKEIEVHIARELRLVREEGRRIAKKTWSERSIGKSCNEGRIFHGIGVGLSECKTLCENQPGCTGIFGALNIGDRCCWTCTNTRWTTAKHRVYRLYKYE